MRKLVIRLAFWALRRLDAMPPPRIQFNNPIWYERAKPYLGDARRLVDDCESRVAPGASGEYKRHQVYAVLIDLYPQAVRRHLALAIEIAVNTR